MRVAIFASIAGLLLALVHRGLLDGDERAFWYAFAVFFCGFFAGTGINLSSGEKPGDQ